MHEYDLSLGNRYKGIISSNMYATVCLYKGSSEIMNIRLGYGMRIRSNETLQFRLCYCIQIYTKCKIVVIDFFVHL